jgi:hypothetical protein
MSMSGKKRIEDAIRFDQRVAKSIAAALAQRGLA